MALVAFPIEHYAKFQDKGGNEFRSAWYSDGLSVVTAVNLLDTWVPLMAALTQCLTVESGFIVRRVEADPTPLVTHGEGEKKASISVKLETETPPNPGQTKKSTIVIPAPIEAMFLAASGSGNNIVNTGYAPLLAFLGQFTAGIALPALTLSDFQHILDPTISGNVEGKRTTRKSSKG